MSYLRTIGHQSYGPCLQGLNLHLGGKLRHNIQSHLARIKHGYQLNTCEAANNSASTVHAYR